MWANVLAGLAIFVSVLTATACSALAVRLVQRVRIAEARAQSSQAAKCSCESQIESLKSCQQETQDALETLANRVKMQRVRNAANHALGGGETITDKEALRRRAGLVAGKPAPHA